MEMLIFLLLGFVTLAGTSDSYDSEPESIEPDPSDLSPP